MKLKKGEVYILIISVLVGILVGLYLTEPGRIKAQNEQTVVLNEDPDEHGRALQIPLDETMVEREEFIKEFKQINGFNLRSLYEKWIDTIGANGLIASVQAVYPTCHDRGHDLGKIIYERTQDIPTALRTCDNACYSGCMHGVFMEAFSDPENTADEGERDAFFVDDHIEIETAISKITDFCDESGEKAGYKLGDCIHGLGHAMMFLADYNIDEAINACDKFPEYAKRYYCATGAYMEFMNTLGPDDKLDDKLFYPCDEVPYPAACFRYKFPQSMYLLVRGKFKVEDLANECLKLEGKYRLGCFHGYGNATGTFLRAKINTLEEICSFGNEDDQYVCIEGLIERLARYNPEDAQMACEQVEGWKRELCLDSVERKMYNLDKSFDLYPR